jgi:hypothetical protein
MNLDSLFFPGSKAPLKKINNGHFIWIPIKEDFN